MAQKNAKLKTPRLPNKQARKTKDKTKPIRAEIPEEVYQQIETLVKEGWFPSRDAIIIDALRRFVDSHTPEIMERHILEDVEWGLRGGK